jgi:hypothetical protein
MSSKIRCGIFTSHFDFATGLNQIALQAIEDIKTIYPDASFILYTYGNGVNTPTEFNKNIPHPVVNLSNKSFDQILEILYRDHCDFIISIIDTWFLAPLFIAKRSFDFYWLAIVFAESDSTLPYHYDSSGRQIMHANYLTEANKVIGVTRTAGISNYLWKNSYGINIPMIEVPILLTPFIKDNKIYKYSYERRARFRNSVKLKDKQYLTIWVGRNFIRKDPAQFIKFAEVFNNPFHPFLMVTSPPSVNTIDLRGLITIYGLRKVQFVTSIEQIDFTVADFYILESNSGLSFSELADLYSGADCLVNTSKAEGLGLPIIEAAKFGLDIIVPEYLYIANTFNEYTGLYKIYDPEIDYIDTVSNGIWNSLSGDFKKPFIRAFSKVEVRFDSIVNRWKDIPVDDMTVIRSMNAIQGIQIIESRSKQFTRNMLESLKAFTDVSLNTKNTYPAISGEHLPILQFNVSSE